MTPGPHIAICVGAATRTLPTLLEELVPSVEVRAFDDLYAAVAAMVDLRPDSLWIDAAPLGEEDIGALRVVRKLAEDRLVVLVVARGGRRKLVVEAGISLGFRTIAAPLRVREVGILLRGGREPPPIAYEEDLIAGLADQLNNPLAALIARLQLAKVAFAAGEERDARDHLELALGSAERLRRTIDKLATFSQRQRPVLGPVDLGALIAETRRRGHRLEVRGKLPEVTADRTLSTAMLESLCAVLADLGSGAPIRAEASFSHEGVVLSLRLAEPVPLPCPVSEIMAPFRLTRALGDPDLGLDLSVAGALARAQGLRLVPISDAGFLVGFEIVWPQRPAS